MEEIVVDHASIETIAPIALALEIPLGMEYPMFLLEMVFAMMKWTQLNAILMVEIAVVIVEQ